MTARPIAPAGQSGKGRHAAPGENAKLRAAAVRLKVFTSLPPPLLPRFWERCPSDCRQRDWRGG
jgi:hypothetical protein